MRLPKDFIKEQLKGLSFSLILQNNSYSMILDKLYQIIDCIISMSMHEMCIALLHCCKVKVLVVPKQSNECKTILKKIRPKKELSEVCGMHRWTQPKNK